MQVLSKGVNLFTQEIVMREICESYLADIRGINEDVTQKHFAKVFTSFFWPENVITSKACLCVENKKLTVSVKVMISIVRKIEYISKYFCGFLNFLK